MKTCNLNIIKISSLLILIFIHGEGFCQPEPAIVSETGFGVSAVYGRNTGNDVLEAGGDRYEVTVWEDLNGNPGIGWNWNNGSNHYGNTTLNYSDAVDPDVSLVVDQYSVVHAIVVYYSPSNYKYYIEVFDWDAIGIEFDPQATPTDFYASATFGTAVNIDADWEANFIVIFDADGYLWSITGDNLNSTLSLNNGGTATLLNGQYTSGATDPDICFYEKDNSDIVTYCYTSYFHNYLVVDADYFNTIASGSSSPTTVLFTTATYSYTAPRIAYPNVNGGQYPDDWTVVVMDSDNSSLYWIRAYNYNTNSLGLTNRIINAGTYSAQCDMYQSYGPVVTYDSQSNISIGWNVVDPSPGFLNIPGVYPIVQYCDPSAIPIFANYWDVPASLTQYETMDYLSLAGRYATDALHCSFYNVDQGDVYSKTKTSLNSATELKFGNPSEIQTLSALLSENSIVKVQLFDLQGNSILKMDGDFKKCYVEIVNYLKQKSNSLYLIEVKSNVDISINRFKIINSN